MAWCSMALCARDAVVSYGALGEFRIYVTNRLAAPTSVHWHAVFLLNSIRSRPASASPYVLRVRAFWLSRSAGDR
jgi:FtsP/CotA-like multicopper oxidase with cupredoxin domain